MRITYYDGPVEQTTRAEHYDIDTLADLASLITQLSRPGPKGSAGYLVAGCVAGRRSNVNTAPTRLVAIDYDGPDVVDPSEAAAGLTYYAHETDSSTPDARRWRVWVLLDREYTPDEVSAAVCPWPGGYLRGASQPAFVPTRASWLDRVGEGAPLSLDEWRPPAPPRPAPGPVAVATSPDPSAAATNALVARWLGDPSGTNRLAGATGAALASWGWPDDRIRDWLAAHLSADGRLAKHTDDALRAAATRREGGRVPGLPTLEQMLGQPFERQAVIDPAPAVGLDPDADGWVHAADISAWAAPPIPWLIEGLGMAPGAPVLLSGYGGTGKTTLAQHLAVAVSSGRPTFAGAVRAGPVTHIDWEQGLDLTARRYQALGLPASAQLRLRAAPGGPAPAPTLAPNDAARAWLARAAEGQALMLLDSLVAGLGPDMGDENAAAIREPLDWLGRVSGATGCTILVVHHARKTTLAGGGVRESARGSSAITDAASCHLTYRPVEDSPPVLQLAKLRHDPPTGLLDGLFAGVPIVRDGAVLRVAGDADVVTVDQQIEEQLLAAGDAGLGVRQITTRGNAAERSAALGRLEAAGRAERRQRGRWYAV